MKQKIEKNQSIKEMIELPLEIKFLILERLSLIDIMSLGQISKDWHEATTAYGLWQKIYALYFPHSEVRLLSNKEAMDAAHQKISKERYDEKGSFGKSDGLKRLFLFIRCGALPHIEKLHFSKEDLLIKNHEGLTPLDVAVFHGHQHLLDYFFKRLLSGLINKPYEDGAKELVYRWLLGEKQGSVKKASNQGSFCIEIEDENFINREYWINARGIELVSWAILYHQENVLRQLLKNVWRELSNIEFPLGDLSFENYMGMYPIHFAAKWRLPMLKILLNEPDLEEEKILNYDIPNINMIDIDMIDLTIHKNRAINIAAKAGDVETVYFLLKKNVRLHIPGTLEHTIFYAIRSGHLETVQAIVAHDPQSLSAIRKGETGRLMQMFMLHQHTPILEAVIRGDVPLAGFLLGHDAVRNAPDFPEKLEELMNVVLLEISHKDDKYMALFKFLLALGVPCKYLIFVAIEKMNLFMTEAILAKEPWQACAILADEKDRAKVQLGLNRPHWVRYDKNSPLEAAIEQAKHGNDSHATHYKIVKLLIGNGAYSRCERDNKQAFKSIKSIVNQNLKDTKIHALFKLEAYRSGHISMFKKKKTESAVSAIFRYLYIHPEKQILEPHLKTINKSSSLKKICEKLEIPLVFEPEVEELSENIIIIKNNNRNN